MQLKIIITTASNQTNITLLKFAYWLKRINMHKFNHIILRKKKKKAKDVGKRLEVSDQSHELRNSKKWYNSRDRRQQKKKMQIAKRNPRKHLRDAEPQKCDDEISKRERERVRARWEKKPSPLYLYKKPSCF